MSNKKLDRALRRSNKKKEDKVIMLSGQLGIPLSGQKLVEVPNRQGFVFVRLKNNTSELIQAYNTAVSPIYDLPVLVARQTNGYRVIGRNIDRYTNQWGQAPYLPKHGAQHSFNPVLNIGGDIVWVYSQQFMPLLGYPSGSAGSPRLAISPYIIQDLSGNWKYVGNTGTPDVTPYSPTTGSRSIMGLLYIDTVSGNPGFLINSGTYIDSSLTGSGDISQYIPRPSASQMPISAIRLVSGTSILTWDNVYDVRPFLQVLPTGSSGGSAMSFQDEGVPLGTATIINVVGVNADVSISGSVARLFITGSTGGGTVNPPITGSFVIQNEGQTLGSALALNAGGRVFASLSGTVAFLNANTVLLKTDDLTSSINGTGTTFQLSFLPEAGTLRLFYNGVRQRFNFNYTVSGTYVETLFTPSTGSALIADYNESSTTGTLNNVVAVQDEGVLQGNVSTLNFVGGNVSASVLNGVATINITGSSSASAPYVKQYESGAVVAVSGTTNEVTLYSGSLVGNSLGANGLLCVDTLVEVNHAVVGTVTLKLYYGTQSLSLAIAQGNVSPNKPGRISFKLASKGSTTSQFVEAQTSMSDGGTFFFKESSGFLTVNSASDQRLQLTAQWGGSNNGLAYIQHHLNIGYYP